MTLTEHGRGERHVRSVLMTTLATALVGGPLALAAPEDDDAIKVLIQRAGNADADKLVAAGSPLYPLTYLYRGRMLTWVTLESGSIWAQPKRRREFLDKARGFFEQAAKAFPENRIARMYLGEPIPPRKRCPGLAGAPEWTVHLPRTPTRESGPSGNAW